MFSKSLVRIDLTTKVQSATQENINLYAIYNPEDLSAKHSVLVKLFTQDGKEKQISLYVMLKEVDSEPSSCYGRVDQSNSKSLSYLYIKDIEGYELDLYSAALREAAFRISLAHGCGGRVKTEAARSDHYFEYEHGFRRIGGYDYYLRLAKAILDSNGEIRISNSLDATDVYLPKKSILNNLKRWDVTYTPELIDTESTDDQEEIQRCEILIEEAKKRDLAVKVLTALNQNNGYGKRPEELQKRTTLFMPAKKVNPSLICENTISIIKEASDLIITQLPINTPQKKQDFLIVVAGMMILAMAYQDKKYDAQPLYDNQRLIPELSFDALIENQDASPTDILRSVGRKALITKQIPFQGKIHPKFFPNLVAIPELEMLLTRCLNESDFEKTLADIDFNAHPDDSVQARASISFK